MADNRWATDFPTIAHPGQAGRQVGGDNCNAYTLYHEFSVRNSCWPLIFPYHLIAIVEITVIHGVTGKGL